MYNHKRRLICLVILLVLVMFGGCGSEAAENPGVRITFFDVGKGDAILIETENKSILIDAGYDDTAEIVLDYLEEQNLRRLDYMILTHFDKDHVGGADRILEKVEVGEILQPDYESDSKQYLEYQEIIEDMETQAHLVTETERLTLDGADFLIYPPQQKEYEEEDNDFSLVISMAYGSRRFLFAGDCEKERLKELLAQKEFALFHDVLKVPHHGRKEKNSEEFLRAVSPGTAVVTCSEKTAVDEEIYEVLEELGTKVYLTGKGTVTCLCDGETLQFIQD